MLDKVISGGQTGADRAGLIAAKNCGIPTGGYIPKGFKTEFGTEPQLEKEFGLIEFGSTYPQRTLANVEQGDATVIFYYGKLERGSALTVKYCEQRNKPYKAIQLDSEYDKQFYIDYLISWLREVKPTVLNVAGNRESVAPGIQKHVENLLTTVFRKLYNEVS